MDGDYINAKGIAKIIPLSVRVIAERVTHRPDFPPAVRIGNRRFWLRSEVTKWIEARREK